MYKVHPEFETDFYKTGHGPQYPENTTLVVSNNTPRSTQHAPVIREFYDDKIVSAGQQGWCIAFLIDCWNERFFAQSREEIVPIYKKVMDIALGAGVVSEAQIAALHDLGYMPIEIRSLKEGVRVPVRVAHWTIHNSKTKPEHKQFFWLVNYLETSLAGFSWKSPTSATIAYQYRKMFELYAGKTGMPLDFCKVQGHDFSARGMSGCDDRLASSFGHALNFIGSDTVSVIPFCVDYYGMTYDDFIVCSIPATEHSVACMGSVFDVAKGERPSDKEYFQRMITQYKKGFVSIVDDTFDHWRFITEYALEFKDQIMARDGTVVFRPDSGDPVLILIGDPMAHPGTPEFKGTIECLWDIFGGTILTGEDGKQFKCLDDHVGVIYGDSITLDRQHQILEGLYQKGFASKVVLGIGSFTYEYCTRDTFGFAVKATYGEIAGEGKELYKDPATDDGMKKSAHGLIRIELEDGEYVQYDQQTWEQYMSGEMELLFQDSKMMRTQTLTEIRELLWPAAVAVEAVTA